MSFQASPCAAKTTCQAEEPVLWSDGAVIPKYILLCLTEYSCPWAALACAGRQGSSLTARIQGFVHHMNTLFFLRLLCSPLKEPSMSQKWSPTSATAAIHSASASQKLLSQGDAGMLCGHCPFLSSFVPSPFAFAKKGADWQTGVQGCQLVSAVLHCVYSWYKIYVRRQSYICDNRFLQQWKKLFYFFSIPVFV